MKKLGTPPIEPCSASGSEGVTAEGSTALRPARASLLAPPSGAAASCAPGALLVGAAPWCAGEGPPLDPCATSPSTWGAASAGAVVVVVVVVVVLVPVDPEAGAELGAACEPLVAVAPEEPCAGAASGEGVVTTGGSPVLCGTVADPAAALANAGASESAAYARSAAAIVAAGTRTLILRAGS
jgi:hypothetical protein